MSGSYSHCVHVAADGTHHFRGVDLLDHLGDAYGALQEMFDMIEHLSGGDRSKILAAHDAHCVKRYGGVHLRRTVEQFFAHDEYDPVCSECEQEIGDE